MLVGIASYGANNLRFLKRVIRAYQRMAIHVDIVVFSEAPKELGDQIEVRVGLPSANPWSLPFAHKQLFAERSEDYDLFLYSEDDVEPNEEGIGAFLRVTEALKSDEIAGFWLYELSPSGAMWIPGMHGPFHWRPESVQLRGSYTIAEFTNEHAAFYVLTRDQLKRAISSGGYLQGPRVGRYDMLCTASTDPYTSCGFRKVLCTSELESFLLHHLPDRYVGVWGLPWDRVREQLNTLSEIATGRHPSVTLCQVDTRMPIAQWAKDFYAKPPEHVLPLVPKDVGTLLSIGCGSGAAELALIESGIKVTALPLNSVIGASVARLGIEVVYATLFEGPTKLKGRAFDCIFLTDLLHLFQNPQILIQSYAALLRPGGCFVLGGPNFEFVSLFVGRTLGLGENVRLRSFEASGVNTFGVKQLKEWLRLAGMETEYLAWHTPETRDPVSGALPRLHGAKGFLIRAWRNLRRSVLEVDKAANRRSADRPVCRAQGRLGIGRFFGQNWAVRARLQSVMDT